MDAGTLDERAELLRFCGLIAARLAAQGALGDVSVVAATLTLYEWMMGPQVGCLRCNHDWEDHEPVEIAAVPQEGLEEAVRGHPDMDYSCRTPGCGCRLFLTLSPDDILECWRDGG